MGGILKLKHTPTGWRHYIVLPDGTRQDINQGELLAAQFDGEWLTGRYEAALAGCTVKDVKARLVVEVFPGVVVDIPLPVGCLVKREG